MLDITRIRQLESKLKATVKWLVCMHIYPEGKHNHLQVFEMNMTEH